MIEYLAEFLANESNRIVFCLGLILALMIIDLITGVMKAAWFTSDFNFSRLRQGIALKFSEMLFLVAAVPTVAVLNNQLVSYAVLFPLFAVFIYSEWKSIIQNCKGMGGDESAYEKILDLFKSKND